MKLSQRIVTNALALSVSHIVCRIISFLLVLAIARHYATELFGQYTFALSFVELFMVLADLGIAKMTVRNVAQSPEDTGRLLGIIGVLKLFYTGCTLALIVVFLMILNYHPHVVKLTLIFSARSVCDSLFGLFVSVFKGHQKMYYIPPFNIGTTLIAVSLCFVCLELDMAIMAIALVFMGASFLKLCIGSIIVFKTFARPVFDFNIRTLLEYSKMAFPFGLGSVFVRIFTRIDTVMLSKLATMTIVGYYNAAYNLVIVLLFLPGAFNDAIFPVMSRFYKTSDKDFRLTFERLFKYSMLIGIPMAVGISTLADRFILLFYGPRYAESIVPLKLLGWLMATTFGTYCFTTTLNASHREKLATLTVLFCSVLNVVLNALFIPRWKHIGASASTLLTEWLFFGMTYIFIRKYVAKTNIVKFIIRPAIASACMYGVIYYLKSFLIIYPIVCGIITYCAVIFILRTLDATDVKLLTNLFIKRK